MLIGPWQDTVAEFGDLHAVLDDDGILADEIDTADMAVEIDAHARPVEAGGDLFDVGRLACSVVAGHHDAPVEGKPGQNGQRGLLVEQIIRIGLRHVSIFDFFKQIKHRFLVL
ncbi:hypothetical protein BLX88_00255 [Bacillus obstructivus]|nr:hypothetical protein BLX88_00255 [Bacillus obstructivus]